VDGFGTGDDGGRGEGREGRGEGGGGRGGGRKCKEKGGGVGGLKVEEGGRGEDEHGHARRVGAVVRGEDLGGYCALAKKGRKKGTPSPVKKKQNKQLTNGRRV